MVVSPSALSRRENRIQARARELDVGPLLRLLAAEGYERHDLLFESNPEQVSSGSIVEAVRFERSPFRRAIVTLNLGLLGANGLLPSYFLRVADESPNPEDFFDFIRFFDHQLLDGFLRAVYPEGDPATYPDWGRTKRFYFGMLGVGSVATLEWLFRLYFPELRVSVSRHAFKSSSQAHALRTGISRLDGTAVLGKVYESDSAGFAIELVAEEDLDPSGTPWARIVHLRLLERVFPLLAPFGISVRVALTLLVHSGFAKIEEAAYLGYERVKQDPDDLNRPESLRIVLFEGEARAEAMSRPVP